VLVAVLVVMMVASLLLGMLLKSCRVEQRLQRRHQLRAQAEELLQSALERAAAQVRRDPQFKGEQWQVPAAELRGHDDALVQIDVLAVEDRPQRRRVSVVVDYPQTLERRIRQRGEAFLDLPIEVKLQ
jgi:type II secretory pathway pseudopilin PulG